MSETIACRLTAPIPSAIATISVRGVSALSLVGKCLDKNVLHWNIGPVRFAQWPIQGSNEHIVVCRVDDQTVEIHSHGGIAVTNSILGDLRMQGCRIVDQAEWAMQNIRRLADPADRLKVFCSQALIQTSSDRAAGILLDQAAGALNECFRTLDRLLQSEQWMAASLMLRDVAKWNELGRHLMNPWKVVLAGPPNVGKSSLINAIAGQTLSIVHHEPGTTREWIECLTQIDGGACSLTDTAGLRATDELVEREGVLRATEQMRLADLVVVVVDASAGWTEQQAEILKLSKKMENRPRMLSAWN